MKTDPFGELGKEDPLGDLGDFKPRTPNVPPSDPTPVRRAAQEHGFVIDNLKEERVYFRTKRRPRGPRTEGITLRIRVRDFNKFARFCEAHGYTQAEGFEALTKDLPAAIDEPAARITDAAVQEDAPAPAPPDAPLP